LLFSPPSSTSLPPPLFLLCAVPPPLCRPCAAPPLPLCCSGPSHVPPPSSATAFPEPRCLLPTMPRRRPSTRAAPRRCSPSLQSSATSYFPATPRVAPWPIAALLVPAAFFHARHDVPAATRASSCRHTRRRHRSSCSRMTTSYPRPRTPRRAPSTLTLVFAYTHFARFRLLRPPSLTGPPPRLLATVVSHLHHPRTPIQCS
jgi:hypothetical protein